MMNNSDYDKYLDEFIACINEEKFYEAHEAIEVLWFKRRFEDNNEVRLLKGFINASVSFELMKKGKIEQSKRVWANYLKYRPLLYKISSKHINKYHAIARQVESLNMQNSLKTHSS